MVNMVNIMAAKQKHLACLLLASLHANNSIQLNALLTHGSQSCCGRLFVLLLRLTDQIHVGCCWHKKYSQFRNQTQLLLFYETLTLYTRPLPANKLLTVIVLSQCVELPGERGSDFLAKTKL